MPTVDDLMGGPEMTNQSSPAQPVEWTDYLTDIPKGVGAGVVGFGQSMGDIVDAGSRFLGAGDVIPREYLTEEALPDWLKTKTMVGSLTSGFTQAAIGLIPLVGEAGLIAKAGQLGKVGAWLNTSGKAASLTRNLLQGAIVDTVAFQGDRGHLSDILKGLGGVGDNPITRYLSTQEDDSWLEGRVKNALEGGIIGTGLEALAFPALKSLKAQLFGKSTEDVAKGIRGAADENVQLLLQDPKEASKRGIISPELAEKLLKVDWSSDQFKFEGANRQRFVDQFTDALSDLKAGKGAEVAAGTIGLTDSFARLKAAVTGRSVDEVYAEMFAGAKKGDLGQLGKDSLFQLDPHLTEPVDTALPGKAPIADGNPATIVSGLETLRMRHPDPTSSTEAFGSLLSDLYRTNTGTRPITPDRLIEYVNKPGAIAKRLKELNPQQIAAREQGMAEADAIGQAIRSDKEAAPRNVGSIVMWGFLSKMLGAFPHESGAIELIAREDTAELFNKLHAGTATAEDIARWKAQPFATKAANGATQNKNSFADDFLSKMVEKRADGRTHYNRLVEIFADSKLTGQQKRRLILSEMPKGHGIGSKVWSFNLLVSGHKDVIVLDRWQIRNFFERNLPSGVDTYSGSAAGEGLESLFTGYKALGVYEAIESGLAKRVAAEYAAAGLKGGSVGDLHWDMWNWISKQSAAHSSLEGISGKFRGDADAFQHAHASETLLNSTLYGTKVYPNLKQASVTIGNVRRWMSLQEADGFGKWVRDNVIPESWGEKAKSLGLPGPFDVTKIRPEILPDDQHPWYNFLPAEQRAKLESRLASLGSEERPGIPSGSGQAGSAGRGSERVLFQSRRSDTPGQLSLFAGDGPRGAVQFAQDGRAIIHIFENADASTAIHEVSHVFRRHLASISPDLLTKAEKALGVSFSGKGQSLVQAEEAWARGFETYVSKGIAPTPELKTVFSQFKDWLGTVYHRIVGSPLKEKISPELRDVFDAMLGKYGPADVTAPKPSSRLPNTPSKLVQSIRTAYMDSVGGNHPGRQRLAEIHQPTAQRIADAYEAMVHNPNDPAVKQSYDSLIAETKAQFETMQKQGIRLVPTDGNPYPSSQAMMDDVEQNKRLYIQKTISDTGGSDLPMDHPMMADSGLVLKDANGKDHKMLVNDVFRGVHDFFGHAAEGYQFGQRGEENAWIAHALMFSPEARPAMTTETRGQNSWVNSGKHIRRPDGSIPVKGDADWIHPNDRPFAQQKAGLLPLWATQHVELGDAPAMAEAIASDLNAAAQRGMSATESIDQAVRGSVNVSRISTTDEAVNVIKAIDEARDKGVGRMTMDEMAELVTSADVSEDEVRAVLGNGKGRESLQKHMSVIATARTMVVQAAENVSQIHEQLEHAANSGADQQSVEELAKALVEEMGRVTDFHNMVQEAKADAGRLVKSFDLTASGEGVQFETIAAAAKDAAEGDAPTEDAIRRMVAKAQDTGNADKAEILKALAEAKPKKTRADSSMDWLHGSGEDMGSVTDKVTREPIEKAIDTTGAENAKPITAAENAAHLRANNGEQVGNFTKDHPAPRGERIPDTTGAEVPGGPSVAEFQRSGGGENMGRMQDGSKPKPAGRPGDFMPDTTLGEAAVPRDYSEVVIDGTKVPVENLLKRSRGIAAAAAAGKAAVEADAKTAANAAKSGWFPIFLEFQKAALLSGMTTVSNNTLSGGIMTAMMPLVHMAGATVSGDTRAMKNSWGLMTQVFAAMRDVVSNTWTATPGEGQQGLRTLKSTVQNEKPTLLGVSGVEHTPKLTAQGVGLSDASAAGKAANVLGRIVRLPFTAHQVMDEFFSNVNYLAYVRNKATQIAEERFINNASIPEAQRQQLASEFVDAYTKGAFTGEGGAITRADGKFFHEDAAKYAKSVNFTQDLTYGLGQSLMKLKGSHPWLDMLIPFVTVPTNIVRMGMRMTPGLNLIANYSARLAGQSAEDVLKARGELAIGTAIWGSSIYMAASGGITGAGPSNPQELATLKASGWQPFSFVTTGADGKKEYTSYARLEPFSMMLGLAADFADSAAYLQEGERNQFAAQAVTSLAHNLTNKTYLTSLTDFLKAVTSPSENGAAYLRNRTAALVPNFFAKMGNAQDDSLRETRTMLDAIRNRLPFAREDSMPRRNLLGETMTPPAGYLPFMDTREGAAGFIGRAASPIQFSRQSSDQVVNELAAMGHAFSKVSPQIQGVDVSTFTNPGSRQTAYDRLQELSGEIRLGGRTMHDELERVINSNEYQKAPMPRDRSEQFNPRIQMLQRVMSRYRLAAQKQTLKEFPDLKQALDGLKVEGKTGRDMSPVLEILSR